MFTFKKVFLKNKYYHASTTAFNSGWTLSQQGTNVTTRGGRRKTRPVFTAQKTQQY